MSSEPTPNNRRYQSAPVPARKTKNGQIIQYATAADAKRESNQGDDGQWFPGLGQFIK